mmetsp:Transcript_114315/g.319455  ORF Transcript_114315/g.319455 Transcript_114315/m.319455 type:complete len:212 (+) Transcript_114315:73-708(+)
MDETCSLLLEGHRRAMQLLCKATEHPYAGLSIAARKASLTSDLRRQLTRLDNTAAMIRHITRPHIEQMLQELCQQLPPDLTTAMSCPCSSHSAVREIRADVADMETRLAQHVCNAEERMNPLESRLTERFGDVESRIQTSLVDLELREKASVASVAEVAAQLERQGEHRGRRDANLIAHLDYRDPEHVRGPQKPRYPCIAAGRRWREPSMG